MTWTKTGDDYPERLFDLSSDAYRLHHAATTYCNRLLTDGRLQAGRLALVPVPEKVRRRRVVAELVTFGLWAETEGGWLLTDFLADQPTKEEVLCRRAYDAVRQRLRYAKDNPAAAVALRREEEATKKDWNDAREARRKLLAHRDSQREVPGVSHRELHRPDPTSPVPPQHKGEGGASSTRGLLQEDEDRPFRERMAANGLHFEDIGIARPRAVSE